MDIIHKVFVSSTYEDLREERAAVERTLLQLQCFPVGMEIFPAADDTAWDFIKSQIDDSDYYVLIVAARYGSIETTTGKSYTEMEYDYAIEKGVPVLAFIHSDPGSIHDDKRDKKAAARAKLEAFREKVQKRLCRHWTSAKELQAEVATTLTSARVRKPREGFVRAGLAVDHKKLADLMEANLRLEAQVQSLKAGVSTEGFAKGEDKVELIYAAKAEAADYESWKKYEFLKTTYRRNRLNIYLLVTWNNVLTTTGHLLMRACTGREIVEALNEDANARIVIDTDLYGEFSDIIDSISLVSTSLDKIELQFRALGWITSRRITARLAPDSKLDNVEFSFTELGMIEYGKLAAQKTNQSR
jgi:hypothetical protein